MVQSNPFSPQRLQFFLRTRLLPVVILCYQLVAVAAFIYIPILAIRWTQHPFIGALVEQTLLINGSSPTHPGDWELRRPELIFSQIQAVAGTPIYNTTDLEKALSQHSIGESIPLTLKSTEPNGKVSDVEVHLTSFPLVDQTTYVIIPYLTGLIYLITGLWVFSLRRKDPTGQAFAIFATSVAIFLAAFFDTASTHRLVYLWTFAVTMIGGSLFNLAPLFPQEDIIAKLHPAIRYLGYVVALIAFGYAASTVYNYANPRAYFWGWRWEFIFASVALLTFFGWTAYRFRRSPSPIAREQAKITLLGAASSFSPLAIWFVLSVFFEQVVYVPYLLIFFWIFPVAAAYAILRYRLLNTDYLLSRGLLYGLLLGMTTLGYALLVGGLTLIAKDLIQTNNPFVLGALTVILAMLFFPLRSRLQNSIDALFSRGQAAYRERLQAFSRELTRAMELPTIIGLLRQYVQQNLAPAQLHIFVHDPLTDQFIATVDEKNRSTSDLRFASNSSLVQSLVNRRNSLWMATTLPANLQPDQARLALLGAQVYVPLPGRQQLAGWMALGPRRSGEPYNNRDLEFIEALCDQAALAVERSQVVSDLERRVHEMNVLTRVSQGINVTIAFDDMLELIFAQTSQVIACRDFRITLRDIFSGILYHVFYLDNDERLAAYENRTLPISQGLEQDVVKSRRPISTDDYERECSARGVLPAAKGLYSWAGVPLNAGAETIGVISLGSRDPSVLFTDEQVNLLQAIADQAAGAIVKARLLQEAERRTRQLTTLNEVARSLTSTLELSPLLNQILNSAVSILNCEAGSLLLVDLQTDELVFEVVVGPPESANLMGQRLPPGAGLVGKAVETRQAVVANDVRRSKEWFEKPDEQTGFNTKDLLVVPMMVKELVIGVIEVINRIDGLPFTPDDQELLAAFTSQAAVAIDNARLYTQTDQTLAERVEELQVMQRIDRELNASLDVSRAMRITLDWAMRQSRSDAGLVGVIDQETLRVMASQGYTTELSIYPDLILPVTLPGIAQAIKIGQPQSLHAASNDGNFTLLNQAVGQVAIPIRRESEVIGMMILESLSVESYAEETLAFLSRLSDHAAIAIANARLYDQVSEANLAKSKFVSFVAHELKNPMASIKGYTELVANGMAGPVNEMQTSFLGTVRNNVDRMNTIVSELNDLTKIEVGGMRLEFKAVQINEIIDEVIRSMNRQIEDKEQKLVINRPEGLPKVWGDPLRLSQILTNLLSNAHKYTPQGGQVTIGIEVAKADPASSTSIDVAHVWVQDTGIGISKEDQEKIFQQYFRTDVSKEMATGTGLGLTITKSLVEMQGGRIWFESELNQGTTFHFTIPVAEAA